MAAADTNKTSDADAPRAGDARTTRQAADTGEELVPAEAKRAKAPQLYVDGKAVSEEVYMKAAADSGYDVGRLQAMNYRPDISTKKHGEK